MRHNLLKSFKTKLYTAFFEAKSGQRQIALAPHRPRVFSLRGSLRNRLIFFLVLPLALLISAFGFYLYKVVERSFQDEFRLRLTTVAELSALQLSPSLLNALPRSSTSTLLREKLLRKLDRVRSSSQVNRIYVFDDQRQSILDTHRDVRPGEDYFHLSLYDAQLAIAAHGNPAASILYSGMDGRKYMTAFVRLSASETPSGVKPPTGYIVAVEGAASFFATLEQVQTTIGQLLALGMLAVIVIASLFARRLLAQIRQLMAVVKDMAEGKLDGAVETEADDEIGFFIKAFNDMRVKLSDRDSRLQLMLHGIAHEVRNPLGGIELFISLLEEEHSGAPTTLGMLGKIKKETHNLKNLVDEFLDFARDTHLAIGPVPLQEFFLDVSSFFADDIKQRGIVLDIAVGGETVRWDPDQMRRVFFNLFKNALQAIKGSGSISISYRLEQRAYNQAWGVISFQDTGVGIKPADLAHIFVPFFTTKEKGSGLGLALAEKIVKLHGGAMHISSVRGEGTTVCVAIPQHQGKETSS